MDCVGRMAELFLCILCLTLVPAKSILQTRGRQEQNQIEVRAEQFCGRIKQEKSLTRSDYEHFKEIFRVCPDYDFELTVARRYVMPVAITDKNAQNGIPVKLLYRPELEEEFSDREEISLRGVFINISVYGKDGYFYTCGGEVW